MMVLGLLDHDQNVKVLGQPAFAKFFALDLLYEETVEQKVESVTEYKF